MATIKQILEQVIKDRHNGVNKKGKHYLHMFPEPKDSEERTRFLGRIYRCFADHKVEIAIAELEALDPKKMELPKMDDSDHASLQEFIDIIISKRKVNNKINRINYEGHFEFTKAEVIEISSDIHLGCQGCDVVSFVKDAKYKLQEKIYSLYVGDMIENKKEFPRNAFAVLSQELSPSEQEVFATQFLIAQSPYIIGYVSGNHEENNARHGERNVMWRCCKAADIDFYHGGCLLAIDILGAQYRIYARHYPKSNSKVSPLLGARKLAELEPNADIYVCGHIHVPTLGIDYPAGHKRICAIAGTYNDMAAYSRIGYGEYSAQQIFPCIVLLPKNKGMVPFDNMRHAVMFRDAFNKEHGYE